METVRRHQITLDIISKDYARLIARAQAVQSAMTAAATQLPSPTPTMAVFATDLEALITAQLATRNRVPGASAVRNAKAVIVVADLESLGHYVQGLCDASPADAATLATAAAFSLRKATVRVKPPLAVTAGVLSGTATLVANSGQITGAARGRRMFNWQLSTDGGKTWTSLPATPLAKTQVTGLALGTVVSFRVSAIVGSAPTAWTDPVSFLAH